MLVFVIPLKSPQVSKSWQLVCKLFSRCVKSICNQTEPDFRVIVVCNQKPEINFTHPHITYLEKDFPPPKQNNPIAKGDTDKGRKILHGLVYAERFKPSHTMTVDADDCINKHLVEFVNQHPQNNGWFINAGYKYQDGQKVIYLKRTNFYRMCGTCNILRYDLNFLPDNPEYNRGYGYYKYHIDHAKVKNILAAKEMPIKPLPFAGAVYILGTGDNLSGNDKKVSFSLFNRRILTPKIRDQFCLYDLD